LPVLHHHDLSDKPAGYNFQQCKSSLFHYAVRWSNMSGQLFNKVKLRLSVALGLAGKVILKFS